MGEIVRRMCGSARETRDNAVVRESSSNGSIAMAMGRCETMNCPNVFANGLTESTPTATAESMPTKSSKCFVRPVNEGELIDHSGQTKPSRPDRHASKRSLTA